MKKYLLTVLVQNNRGVQKGHEWFETKEKMLETYENIKDVAIEAKTYECDNVKEVTLKANK